MVGLFFLECKEGLGWCTSDILLRNNEEITTIISTHLDSTVHHIPLLGRLRAFCGRCARIQQLP